MKSKTVYLSGPITGNENYEWEFKLVEATLAGRFRHVINPAAVLKPVAYLDYTALMHMCLVMVSQADAIIMLPGWRASKGAQQELRLASHYGMQVLEYVDQTGDLVEISPSRKPGTVDYYDLTEDDEECLGLRLGLCSECPEYVECDEAVDDYAGMFEEPDDDGGDVEYGDDDGCDYGEWEE